MRWSEFTAALIVSALLWLTVILGSGCSDDVSDLRTDANLIIDDVYSKLDDLNERQLATESRNRGEDLCLVHLGCTPGDF